MSFTIEEAMIGMYDFEVLEALDVIRRDISPSGVRVIDMKEFILQTVAYQFNLYAPLAGGL